MTLDGKTRSRRDQPKYLTLIRTLAYLRQHQRSRKTATHEGRRVEYVEVTVEDIESANTLAHEVLGHSLDDLPPQTRRLLHLVSEMVETRCRERDMDRADFRFSRREVREETGWGQTQLKVHLRRLVDRFIEVAGASPSSTNSSMPSRASTVSAHFPGSSMPRH